MKTKAMKLIKTCALFMAFTLTACGGSGSADSLAPTSCSTSNLSACGGSRAGTTSTTTAAVALFTTAPTAITLTSGGSATYAVGGGKAPYAATSSNTSLVTTTVSGTTLTISGISTTSNPPPNIAVVDSAGKLVTISVTVLGRGQTGIPPSITPASLTTSDCTTNIPFVFTGGTAPFTIFTSDNVLVPVSNAMPVGSDSYFMATLRAFGGGINSSNATQTLTVLDSQSRTAVATINVASAHATCPFDPNPLLQIVATSQNARVSEMLAFKVTGGVAPYTFTFIPSPTTPDQTIATVIPTSDTSFNVQAGLNAGYGLLSVHSSDGQNANITFTVLP